MFVIQIKTNRSGKTRYNSNSKWSVDDISRAKYYDSEEEARKDMEMMNVTWKSKAEIKEYV